MSVYEEALAAYKQARREHDRIPLDDNGYGPAGPLTEAENRIVSAALTLADAVVVREGLR
jgi:hypothetical protein